MRTNLSATNETNQRFTKNNSFQIGKTKSAAPVEKQASKPDLASSQAMTNPTASNSQLNSVKSSIQCNGPQAAKSSNSETAQMLAS